MYRLKFILSRLNPALWSPRRPAVVIFFLLLFNNSGFSQSGAALGILARVGDRVIDEKEFVERFELSPALNRRSGRALKQAKLGFIYSLVGEKLLAQAAAEKGLERDSSFQAAFYEIRKLIARDLLYREEISKKVQVTRAEIVKGMEQARRQLTVSFLFFDEQADAEFVRKQIRTASDFEKLVLDSSMNILRDTATVIWGDAEWEIEREAYNLKPKIVSAVVAAGSGYYILKILKEQPSNHFNSMSVEALQREVSETLRLRKERVRLDEYVRLALKDKQGYAIRRSVSQMASAITAVLKSPEFRSDSTLTPVAAQEVRRQLGSSSADSLAVVGSEVWSMEFVLAKLARLSLAIPARETQGIFASLNRQLMIWVQQELLAQEGIRRKLDERPDGSRKLAMWRDAVLAAAMKERIAGSVTVTESDLWKYASESDDNVRVPTVTIRELWSASLSGIEEAIGKLQKGSTFADVVAEHSADSVKNSGGLVTFPITSRRPLGDIAFSLSPGELYGPVQAGERFLLLQLVRKDTMTWLSSGMTEDQIQKANREVRGMKIRRAKNEFLAAEGKERGFTLFQDQIEKVEVSPVPMMTFRILGFGGRMLEVPFVDPDLDWLNIDQPDIPIP